jgi:flagellar hook-associated protein 1 FlgK
VARIRLAADRFLQAAGLNASAGAAEAGASAEFLDAAQSLFGDPASDTSFFSRLDGVFSKVAASASEPASAARRSEAVNAVASLFEDAARISGGVQALRTEADARIASGVARANQLLTDIESLNAQISRSAVAGGDASGAQNAQARLIDELATLMDVRSAPRAAGGVSLRTSSGLVLAGDGAARCPTRAPERPRRTPHTARSPSPRPAASRARCSITGQRRVEGTGRRAGPRPAGPRGTAGRVRGAHRMTN